MKKNLLKQVAVAALAVTLISAGKASLVCEKPILGSPLTANAAESCCSYNSNTSVLTLHGNVNKEEVQKYLYYIGNAVVNDYYVTKVVCEEGTVFPEDCSSLFRNFEIATEIDLSNADTSNVTNMKEMFGCCFNLKKLNLKNFDTSKVTNMKDMFWICEKLPELDVSSFDTSNVTNMNSMFAFCSELEKLDLSNFNTSNVNDTSAMFISCNLLTDLDISSFDTRNVTNMARMFESCSILEELDLSHFNTSNATSMFGMFTGCKKLKKVDLSNFDTSKATNLQSMFSRCYSLPSLDLSSFDTANVTRMAGMFESCQKIKEIDISSFDTKKVTEINRMFSDCTELESIIVANTWSNSAIKESDWAFKDCQNLVGGNGTVYDPDKTDSTYACADTEQTPGYLTLVQKENKLKGTSVTLDGTLGLNFYAYINETVEKAVLSGPNGDTVIDLKDKEPCGTTKLTYNIDPTQARDIVTLKLYGKNGEQINFLIGNKSDVLFSQYDCSVQNCIDKYKSDYDNGKVYNLVDALDNYCKAAENYFKGTGYTIEGIDAVTADNVRYYAPVFDDKTRLSLVLNSSIDVRIYTDSSDVVLYGNDMTSNTSKYGQYYEFHNAPANMLFVEHYLNINGKSCRFSPMSYVYRVLNNPNSDGKLSDIAKAIYVYGKAAKEYIG